MKTPDIPATEERRLSTLHALGILDTLPDGRFDAITNVTSRLFDVPIALISLVDERRQWFKSRKGLTAIETPRDISFCGHAINGNDIFLVPDAASDPRFSDNPLVVGDPKIRFYAGRPLAAPNGEKLGTLCLIDRKARALDGAEHKLLNELGSWVEAEIALLSHWDTINRFLNRLLGHISEPVLLADDDMIVRFANAAALRLLQYKPDELAGRSLLKLLPEKQRMRFEVDATALQRADNGVASLEYAAQMRRRDASEIPVILALFRTMAAGHSVTAIVVRLS